LVPFRGTRHVGRNSGKINPWSLHVSLLRFARQKWISISLIVAGLSLLIYVSVQYGTMYYEQRRLAQEWQRQQNEVAAQPDPQPATDSLTRLVIPKIKLDVVVVEGTARRQLLIGPGHIENTAAPGNTGNNVITGHRDTFFRHIFELDKGDIVELQRGGATYQYEVTAKKIVDPSDVSVIQPTKDAQLTLITCYPTYYIGPAPERLVVSSRLLNTIPSATSLKRTSAGSTP
jgi:sortase A